MPDPDQLKTALGARMETLCQHLFPLGRRQGAEWRVGNLAGEPGNSLHIALEGPRTGCAIDFATGDSAGNPLDLWMQARQCSFSQALSETQAWLQDPALSVPVAASYEPCRKSRPSVEAAHKRQGWPRFRWGTRAECAALGRLRGLPVEAALAAQSLGVLRFATWKRHRAWVLLSHDGRLAQARRLDGCPWAEIGGQKAYTLPGSEGGLLGLQFLQGNRLPVLLTEGGPDFLAALHLCAEHEFTPGWQNRVPLAFLGASHRFRPEHLRLLQGRHVRILAHADEAGERAANRWSSELHRTAEVEIMRFSDLGAEDLNAWLAARAVPECEDSRLEFTL